MIEKYAVIEKGDVSKDQLKEIQALKDSISNIINKISPKNITTSTQANKYIECLYDALTILDKNLN